LGHPSPDKSGQAEKGIFKRSDKVIQIQKTGTSLLVGLNAKFAIGKNKNNLPANQSITPIKMNHGYCTCICIKMKDHLTVTGAPI
jgi:hypothetical protein